MTRSTHMRAISCIPWIVFAVVYGIVVGFLALVFKEDSASFVSQLAANIRNLIYFLMVCCFFLSLLELFCEKNFTLIPQRLRNKV